MCSCTCVCTESLCSTAKGTFRSRVNSKEVVVVKLKRRDDQAGMVMVVFFSDEGPILKGLKEGWASNKFGTPQRLFFYGPP